MIKNCIYCANKTLYSLANGHLKCSKCQKKFSPKKYLRQLQIAQGFCDDESANELSKKLGLNYETVAGIYAKLRIHLAYFAQLEFENHESYISEYDEYLYIPKNKQKEIENIYDAQNFLIFDYGKIYTLMLPFSSKFLRYAQDPAEVKRFVMHNKIARLQSSMNTINDFCRFFEENIKRYKGVSGQNFHYYLKEIEFKFNYEKDQRFELFYENIFANPESLWFQG